MRTFRNSRKTGPALRYRAVWLAVVLAVLALLMAAAPTHALEEQALPVPTGLMLKPDAAATAPNSPPEDPEYVVLGGLEHAWFEQYATAVAGPRGAITPREGGTAMHFAPHAPASQGVAFSDPLAARLVAGTVDLSRSLALTGRFVQSDAIDDPGMEANLGVRFSTRAGEQFVVAVEPSLSWGTGRAFSASAARSSTGDPEDNRASLNVGASATYAISDRFYVTGMAQVEQYMVPFESGLPSLRETNVVGGFLTGVRF